MENKRGGDLICRRPETIIEARYMLTKKQNDILDMVFATIESDDKLKYEIDINKYAELYNIKDKSNIYRDLKKAVRTFEGKGFAITQKISEKKENRIYFSWFSSITYLDGESKILIELGKTLKELMLSAKKACFYQIKYPLNFHNIYSKRLYYYLKSYENSNKNGSGWRIDNLDELRSKLECPKSYNRFADFRKYVLTPAYEEINGGSDISFEYEILKSKGKVYAIKFYIKSNPIKNEIAATSSVPSGSDEEHTEVSQKQLTFIEEALTPLDEKKIIDTAGGDIELIREKYEIAQYQAQCQGRDGHVENLVGWLIKAIKNDYKKPVGMKNKWRKPNSGSNERQYDAAELERQLLERR